MIKPLLFGYLRGVVTAPDARAPDVARLRTAMLRFAQREGWELAQVFVETRARPPWIALDSLREAARFTDITAVLIPDASHLGTDQVTRDRHRGLIEASTGVPVIAIHINQ